MATRKKNADSISLWLVANSSEYCLSLHKPTVEISSDPEDEPGFGYESLLDICAEAIRIAILDPKLEKRLPNWEAECFAANIILKEDPAEGNVILFSEDDDVHIDFVTSILVDGEHEEHRFPKKDWNDAMPANYCFGPKRSVLLLSVVEIGQILLAEKKWEVKEV